MCRAWSSAVAAVALIGGLISAAPAAASDGGDPVVVSEDASRDSTSTDRGADGDSLPDNSEPDEPDAEPPIDEPLVGEPLEEVGPSSSGSEHGGSSSVDDPAAIGADASDSYGGVEESTFDTMWDPGSVVPSRVSAVFDGDNVELHTWRAENGSAFLAWLVIGSADAATEYRFERAVPEGYSASVQPDGSVLFVDAQGDEAGGIAVPWAFDANGSEVPTRFRLDGDALVQTVDHSGADYPVTADPAWLLPLVAVAIRVSVIYGPRVAAAVQGCQRVQCGPVIGEVIKGVSKLGNRKPSGRRPSQGCRAPNRSGC